ncbi:MAG: threonine synthase [Anaerolineales bacterium]
MLYSKNMSELTSLECPECGTLFDHEQLQTICINCDSPLLCRYDLAGCADKLDKEQISSRPAGLWRWHELLPVHNQDFYLRLGEGDTPLLPVPRIAAELGLGAVFVKDEGSNPTGSFKARGLAVAVSRAKELGAKALSIPTAGNAGGALAAYAARANLEVHVFMPADAPMVYQVEVGIHGGELYLVDGLIDEAGRQAALHTEKNNWFGVSTFKEPYRVEGKKTMGYELAEAFNWSLPEVIVYPTGGGTGLVGMWKAFSEMEAMGWIGADRPRMVCVQSEGCAPVVKSLKNGEPRTTLWTNAETIAHGIRVPHVYADRLVLNTIRESGGTGIAVSDVEFIEAQTELAQKEGIHACLEGAATLAGLRRMAAVGEVGPDERIVLFNTGAGLKQMSVM